MGISSAILLSACTNNTAAKTMNDMSTTAMQMSNETAMSGEMKDEMHGDSMKNDDMMKSDDMMSDSMKSDDMMKNDTMKSDGMKSDDMMKNDTMKSDMSETGVSLSDYMGKKTYVKFWASWCSICLAGLEDIDKLSAQDKDFEVVTVVNPGEKGEKSREEFTEWFNGLGYKNIKVIFDDGSLTQKYGIVAFPTSVYLNSDGTDAKVSVGHSDNKTIQENIEMLQ